MVKRCYICGRVLSESPSENECKCHYEHIIPNAIGGHLTSRKILCESCGNSFSKEDKAFTDIFAPIIVMLHQRQQLRPLDRDNVKKKTLRGEFYGDNTPPAEPISLIIKMVRPYR